MKNQAWLFLAVIVGTALYAVQEPEEALLGFDPISLIEEGKEELGDEAHYVDRGRFRYYFVSDQHKARFERDPEKYEIQLDGICAKVGGDVQGRPEIFTVYKKQIYIFATPQCLSDFEEAPDLYLSEHTPR